MGSVASEKDVAFFSRFASDFVPPGSFDAHSHLFDPRFTGGAGAQLVPRGETSVSRRAYDRMVGAWMGDRVPSGGLFFPWPVAGSDVAAQNRFLEEQIRDDPSSRGLLLVTPADDPAAVEEILAAGHGIWRGFKVYHVFAQRSPEKPEVVSTFHADCEDFIPEWLWEIANARELVILLHLVRPRALADHGNQRYIQDRCLRFPKASLVLAHAGRGFNSRHTVEGVGELRGLDNIFFDSSAVCESAALEAVVRQFGPTRLFFGLDHPVSSLRGRCVGIEDGFFWTNEAPIDWHAQSFAAPTLVGVESILALKQACRTMHMNSRDIELIFGGAARQLLGLPAGQPQVDVQAQYREAKALIPGGTQLLSKRPEMFAPEKWPAYYEEARGCEVIDTQGRKFIDMSTGGILACILGYADEDVNAAVIRRARQGSMSSLQSFDEVELAKKLIEIHPWASMARFARTGGEVMAIAVRAARAFTGRDQVAVCGYHGWHDWYLAANLPAAGMQSSAASAPAGALAGHLLPGLEPNGVPCGLGGLTHTFSYNRVDELDDIIDKYGPNLAAVVMEPTRGVDPIAGFLEGVRERCDRNGSLLVFDEITIGWRLCLGGAHQKFGVEPDLAAFAKAMSNGYALSGLIGKRPAMEALQNTFVSSAYWTEALGPAAGLAAVRKMQRIDVPAHLNRIGRLVMDGWTRLAERHGLPMKASGRPELATLLFDHPDAAALQTLMTVRMLDRGFLAGGGFNAMLSHQPRHVTDYLAALDEVCRELQVAAREFPEAVRRRIGTPVRHTGFSRLVN